MKIIFLFVFACFTFHNTYAQSGGYANYRFLDLPYSARNMGMANVNIATRDADVQTVALNPSSLNSQMHNIGGATFTSYFAGIKYGQVVYAHSKGKHTIAAGIQYLNYGKFVETDAGGNTIGNFGGRDMSVNLSYAQQLDSSWSVGLTTKLLSSALERYTSFAAAIDAGVTYRSKDKLFGAALVVKNLGKTLNNFTSVKDKLPTQVAIGLNVKPQYLPLTFHFLIHDLQRFDLSYKDTRPLPTNNSLTGDTIIYKKNIGDKITRHLTLGAELNLGKSLTVRLGYDFLKRKDMVFENRKSTVGFSWGIGINLKKFSLQLGRANYYLKSSPTTFSINYQF